MAAEDFLIDSPEFTCWELENAYALRLLFKCVLGETSNLIDKEDLDLGHLVGEIAWHPFWDNPKFVKAQVIICARFIRALKQKQFTQGEVLKAQDEVRRSL